MGGTLLNIIGYLQGVSRRLGPPLAVLLLGQGLLGLVTAIMGLNALDANTLVRWDSGHYLSIATEGYELISCSLLSGWNSNDWCGNAGWLPAYPWMIRLISLAGLEPVVAGALISFFFHLATLVLVWNRFLDAKWCSGNVLCLLFAGFFPSWIYHYAVFPISAFTFCTLLTLYYLREQRSLGAGFAGAAAALTYSSGVVLALVAIIGILITGRNRSWRQRLTMIVIAPGCTLSGFAAVLLVQQHEVGDWMAFFKVQAKYGHGLHNPVATFMVHMQPLFQGALQWKAIPALQTLFVASIVALVLGFMFRHRRDVGKDIWPAIFMLVFWVFPLVIGPAVSPYRAESLLLPSAVLIRYLPVRLQKGLFTVTLILAFLMAMLFYSWGLI